MRKNVSSRSKREFHVTALASPRLIPTRAGPTPADDALITVAEAARKLKVSRGLIYQMIHRGELAGVAIRRVVRVRADDLDRLIEAGRIGLARSETADGLKPESPRVEGRLARWKRQQD